MNEGEGGYLAFAFFVADCCAFNFFAAAFFAVDFVALFLVGLTVATARFVETFERLDFIRAALLV